MAKTRKIQHRMSAVKSIRTVTRAMQMVAAARFRRLQRLSTLTDFARRQTQLVDDIARRCGEVDHPLLHEPPCKRDVLLLLTSDAGFCGAFNEAVLRIGMERLGQLLRVGYEVSVRVVGKHGIEHLEQSGFRVDRSYADLIDSSTGRPPDIEAVTRLADEIMQEFLAGEVSGLEAGYVQFVSASRQNPAVGRVMPLGDLTPAPAGPPTLIEPEPYEFHPSREKILDRLLTDTVRSRLYQCFLESAMSQQAMRIQAMRAATDNADKMLRNLTKRYNRLRQAQITTELAELMSGADADGGRDAQWQVHRQLAARRARLQVTVTSAVALEPAARQALIAMLTEKLRREIDATFRVDGDLVAGLTVAYADTVLDASVAGGLRGVRERGSSRRQAWRDAAG